MKRLFSVLIAGMVAVAALALPQSAPAFQATPPAAAKSAPKSAATPPPSDKDIADAKAKGMVWVNTNTKVYHKDGQFYGKTKQGKFMSEADAQKAGYRAAQAVPAKKAAQKK